MAQPTANEVAQLVPEGEAGDRVNPVVATSGTRPPGGQPSTQRDALSNASKPTGSRYPLVRGERWALGSILVALAFLVLSLVGPWWKGYDGEYLAGGDAKGWILLALLTSAVVLILRFATPIRPIWTYASFTVIAIIVFFAGQVPASEYEAITPSVFQHLSVAGLFIFVPASIAGVVVALRSNQRMVDLPASARG